MRSYTARSVPSDSAYVCSPLCPSGVDSRAGCAQQGAAGAVLAGVGVDESGARCWRGVVAHGGNSGFVKLSSRKLAAAEAVGAAPPAPPPAPSPPAVPAAVPAPVPVPVPVPVLITRPARRWQAH